MADRSIHATCAGFDVVRYDRSGKWFVESRSGKREHVTVSEAAVRAEGALAMNGGVAWDISGGGTFDRLLRLRISA